jgi:hypothetical protein
MWLALKMTAISISSGMPAFGDNFPAMADVIKLLLLLLPCSAIACDFPDEGNLPLRRAVARVETHPAVDDWIREMRRQGIVTQVAVLVAESVRRGGRCYWPVEVRAEGALWRRYLVTPDGKRVIDEGAPKKAASRPAASRPAAPTPASR